MRSLFILLLLLAVTARAFAGTEPPERAQEVLNLGLRGVYFVPNEGQWSDREVIYGLRSRGLDVALRESALTMHLARQSNEASPKRQRGLDTPTSPDREGVVLDAPSPLASEQLTLTITFPGSNAVQPIGAQPQSAKFNYFVGGEGRGVATDVPSFGAVIYENLYDGIDLHVMGSDDGVLKYEFHCAPGADYKQIRIHYDGIESLCIDDSGNLHIKTSFGTLADAAPVAWYAGGANEQISTRFELAKPGAYSIVLDGDVDLARGLVIDPEVQWARYLGGSLADIGRDVAVDLQGDILIVGETSSTDFEGRTNSRNVPPDAFVVKMSPAGDLRWMTYLGGASHDSAYGVAIDVAGTAVIAGETFSSDFPGRGNSFHGGFSDAFVARVSSSGALQGMLYLGGTSLDRGDSIALDHEGNMFVSGRSESTDFDGRINTNHGGSDAYVVRLSAAGVIDWMTYLGGSEREDSAFVALDGLGAILVAGETRSLDFEGMANQHHGGTTDSYLASVDPSGDIQWMKYVGGSSYESNTRVVLDSERNAIVGGSTGSPDLERANNIHHGNYDAFLAKLSPGGALLWSTYMGGADRDIQFDIAVGSSGNVIAMGETQSWDFEGQNNTKNQNHFQEGFVTRTAADGTLLGMSFIHGQFDEETGGIAVGLDGRAIMAATTVEPEFEGQLNQLHGGVGRDAIAISRRIKATWLSIASSCPAGGPIQVSWTDATPGAPVALVYAPDPTWYVIPGGLPCADSLLNIGGNGLRVVFRGTAGANGSRTLNATAGPDTCGKYLQLIELSTCDKSNVVRIE